MKLRPLLHPVTIDGVVCICGVFQEGQAFALFSEVEAERYTDLMEDGEHDVADELVDSLAFRCNRPEWIARVASER